jgi:medium-chain acyl-[acyl-carrier-protein] hydrolase
MNSAVLERDYYIHYYEVDYKKRCLISSLLNYFEDAAIIQSESRGVGIDYLRENKIAWVLYKWDIKIERPPVHAETIKVRTYPYSFMKFYAYRKFEVIDSSGNVIVAANSMWLLINTENKKPVKIVENIYEAYGIDRDRMDALETVDAAPLSRVDSIREFEVRYSDIDTNRHVNNVKYVDWSIETVPMEVVLDHTLKRLKATYKKETTYGATIKAATEVVRNKCGVTCLHKITDSEGKELCLLETEWSE